MPDSTEPPHLSSAASGRTLAEYTDSCQMMTRPHADLTAEHAIAPSHLTKRVHADQKKRRRCGAPLTTSATERSGNEGGQFDKIGPPADRRHIVVIGPAHDVELLRRFRGDKGPLA